MPSEAKVARTDGTACRRMLMVMAMVRSGVAARMVMEECPGLGFRSWKWMDVGWEVTLRWPGVVWCGLVWSGVGEWSHAELS